MKIIRMNHILFISWAMFFYSFEAIGITVVEDHGTCQDEDCLNKYQNESEKIVDYKVSVTETNSNQADIFFVPTSEVPFELASDKNNYKNKVQEIKNKYDVFTSAEEKTGNAKQPSFSTTDIEISEVTTEEVFSSTVEFNITKTVPTETTKLDKSTPATQIPSHQPNFFVSKSFKESNNICFCDLQINQCDINCCCDKDCSETHFKVFTKCLNENVMYDSKYCYKSNFVFKNNTFHEIIQNDVGYFCIVKENLKVGQKLEGKPTLKTLEAFNKSLPNKLYNFSYKSLKKSELIPEDYLFGSLIWTIENEELIPLRIPFSSVGLLCDSSVNLQYLVDQVKVCYYQQHFGSKCGNSEVFKVLHHLRNAKIISNLNILNKSQSINSSKICGGNKCIKIDLYLCQSIENAPDCTNITNISENLRHISEVSCRSVLSHVHYQIWHNGSDGIMKMEVYVWIKKSAKESHESLLYQLISEVRYAWVNSTQKRFKRSGNPGYLTGKPILAGRKVYNVVNGTFGKKEAIHLSMDSKDWLSVAGSKNGFCSSKDRIPINFRENGQYSCSLKLSKSNFSKDKCIELQTDIFKLLIRNDITNETKENFFNLFVATYGNSKVEETGDWVQVLIDLTPIISSQTEFKPNHHHLTCKNIITDLYINVIYSKIGSFLTPQAKILGVVFKFGKHKDLTYYCDTPGCKNTSLVQYFKLSTAVHFVDVTKPATDAFAEPLSLEAKLPYDFFYPFSSKSVRSQFLNKFIFVFLLLRYFF